MNTEIEKVRVELEKYARAYEMGNPMITDKEFDQLHREYKMNGGEPITMVTKGTLAHNPPMSSMADTFTVEEAIVKVSKEPYYSNTYVLEPKWDGVSGSFIYENGKLVQALTRGDGKTGNPILNYGEIGNLPLEIPTLNKVTVRGELMIRVANFDYDKLSNPRNTVAGAIRKSAQGTIRKLKIEFVPWDVIFDGVDKHSSIHTWLKCNGFQTLEYELPHIVSAYSRLTLSRSIVPFEMDGLVVKIDDKKVANRLGMGSKYSNYMFALKFRDKEYITKVEDLVWQMGMNGTYTPVVVVTPTLINGVVVTRVTLHNIEQIEKAQCGVGSQITIIRSGDVIPKYIRTTEPSKELKIPKLCQHCYGKLIVMELACEGDKLYRNKVKQLVCTDDNCIQKGILKMVHFTKRGYLNIMGLSEKSIVKLWGKYLKTYPDLFKLTKEQLVEVLGKNGEKIYSNIQYAKGMPLSLLLGSIPMHNGGRSVFKLIDHTMTYDDMIKVKGIGPETARSITNFISENSDMINELIRVAKPTVTNTTVKATYGISGKIPNGRPALIKKLEEVGWKKTSGKADYFIAGEGAVLNKAKGEVIKFEDLPKYVKI